MARPKLSFLLSVVALLSLISASSAVRNADVSSFVNTGSGVAVAFFHSPHYLYSGGVSLRARSLKFLTEDNSPIGISDLNLQFEENGGSVKLGYKNALYELPIEDAMVCPLAMFVARGAYTIYTIPVVRENEQYFSENGLVETGGGYVAKEFAGTKYESLLDAVDLGTETGSLPSALKKAIIDNINSGLPNLNSSEEGTYVNADFNIDYKAYLTKDGDRRFIDIAGLPLRYVWDVGAGEKAVIRDVEIFQFPRRQSGLQYQAVLLFQNAAVMRQFATQRSDLFQAFLKSACNYYDQRLKGH
ncbi:hypothetical protein AB8Z38_23565 [Bradyrhizobium sp. LLZ17]|uniref:Uncharacterized protein n=1 Tax=Bradyrhizobium sp. LLZ17 TaxID=3239388 RepID=A0AB39XF08_9BRAD